MISRNLDKARDAYKTQDVEASRLAHDAGKANVEKHKKGGEFLKSLVYGGLDGIITTFAIVMAALGADLKIGTVLVLGISNMFSDGLSMAIGDYLSSKAEIDFNNCEKARETWEVENNPDGERLEMEELYMKKGMDQEDAHQMSYLISKKKDVWIDIMMVEELGLIQSDESPVKNALVTFFAFVGFGVVPILPFIFAVIGGYEEGVFLASTILTGISLCILGLVKVVFTQKPIWISVGETFILGALAAFVSWGIGKLLEGYSK